MQNTILNYEKLSCTVGITQYTLKGRVFKIRLKLGTFLV